MTEEKEPRGSRNRKKGLASHAMSQGRLIGTKRYAIVDERAISSFGTLAEFKVYTSLALHANGHGRCWPSLKTLQKITELDRSSVCKALTSMELAGCILTYPGQGPRSVTIYQLQPHSDLFCEEYRTAEDGPGGYFVSIVFTSLKPFMEAGLRVGVRSRKWPKERCEEIDRFNSVSRELFGGDDGQPILTPGVVLSVENEKLLKSLGDNERLEFMAILGMTELLIAQRLLPWSVIRMMIENRNQKLAKDTPPIASQPSGSLATRGVAHAPPGIVAHTPPRTDHLEQTNEQEDLLTSFVDAEATAQPHTDCDKKTSDRGVA